MGAIRGLGLLLPSKPGVSVIIPACNGEFFLNDAIESIRNQSYENWELLVCDDGSGDLSYEICLEHSKQEPRIRLCKNENNMGLAKTMNRLVSLCEGKYIAIQEQDDYSMPNRLEKEYEYLESNPKIDLVSGVAAWVDDHDQVSNYFPGLLHRGKQYPSQCEEMVKFLYLEQCKFVNAACMFRKDILIGIAQPFDPEARMSIDWQFFIRMAHQHRFAGIPEVLIKMRRGASHSSLTKNKALQFLEARRCIKKILNDYENKPSSPINKQLFKQAMARELNLEGRYYGRWKGFGLLIKGLIYNCFDSQLWISFKELVLRAFKKMFKLKSVAVS